MPALLIGVALQAGIGKAKPVAASTPSSGTVSATNPTTSWDFAAVGGSSSATDSYALTVQLPDTADNYYAPDVRQGSAHAAVLTITITWTNSSPDQEYGLTVTNSHGSSVGNDVLAVTNDDASNVDTYTLQDPLPDTYMVTAGSKAGTPTSATDTPHAVATLQLVDLASEAQPPEPAGAPQFDDYHLPLSLMPETMWESTTLGGRAFGEPSIGADANTDAVMYQAGLYTIKATFDTSTPASPTWTNVGDAPLTTSASEDAILYNDRNTGRTLVSQLTAVCSLSAFTDNDGTSWTPAAKPCESPPAVDHQTIGGGPFAAPVPQGAVYPDALYYCSQNVAIAECALSLDGGISYGAGVPIYNSSQCFGLHGHVKVAPDGTVYVPNKLCGAPECLILTSTAGPNCHPGFAVSTNNGASWTVHTINDGHGRLYDSGDPAIGIGSHGAMYYGYGDRDGTPRVAVCTQQGTVCGPSVDVSGPFRIHNVELASMVAGDDDRAAFAFIGSSTPGDDQAQFETPQPGKALPDSFVGTWHLYVAVTYDGGHTWNTSDATPTAPIERGCIEFNASCPSARGSDDQRNLLDFNDITIDKEGRIYAAYTDGCQMQGETDPQGYGTCLTDATRLSGLATEIESPAFARQNCGKTLFAAFDGTLPACSTLAAKTPEVANTGLLAGSGAVAIGIVGYIARRRRKRQPA